MIAYRENKSASAAQCSIGVLENIKIYDPSELFRRGFDTLQIARLLNKKEVEIYNVRAKQRASL
jgi:hypothetical protein